MSHSTQITVETSKVARMAAPALAAQFNASHVRLGALAAGYSVLTDWHPVVPAGWGEFPQATFPRSVVYRGDAQSWAYSHHQSIVKFGDQYVAAWSNGLLHEDYVGQEVHYASSRDGVRWSETQTLAATSVESRLVRFNSGLCVVGDTLYCLVGVAKDFERDRAAPGMSILKEHHIHLDAYTTTDLKNWKHHESICDDIVLYEGPRKTRDGSLLCCGFNCYDSHGMVLRWLSGARPTDPPQVAAMPFSPQGVIPTEGTWYQEDNGRIRMFVRDGNVTGHLGLSWSEDDGRTWSEAIHTDLPNSSSRAFAGRLADGRYFILGNNCDRFLDRMALHIMLSDDGMLFDRQYILVDGPTTRRVNGRHKENGYHYPHACVDGDKLLVVYSVNKEDVEVGIVETNRLA
jgi:hypothetical protein